MQTFEQIQYQVGPWSLKNFGNQETPYLGAVAAGSIMPGRERQPSDKPGDRAIGFAVAVELGGLAPLMGIAEEIGELFEGGTTTETTDAVGDICIYLCDYCCREGIVVPYRVELAKDKIYDSGSGLVVYAGKLMRAHLKRYQRIREMYDDEKFAAARLEAIRGLMFHLDLFVKEHLAGDGESPRTNLITILNETWNGIVKKRDWRADADEGGGHSHYNDLAGRRSGE